MFGSRQRPRPPPRHSRHSRYQRTLPIRPDSDGGDPGVAVSYYLSSLPLWSLIGLLVVIPTARAVLLQALIHRWVGADRLVQNNEIAGFKFATVGVIYAVLLAFTVIVVWEKFTDAETAVVQEAGAAATLYPLASGPEPEAAATRAALTNYLRLSIDR